MLHLNIFHDPPKVAQALSSMSKVAPGQMEQEEINLEKQVKTEKGDPQILY